MADFTPITTQEEFDAAIKERLTRDREAQAKKTDWESRGWETISMKNDWKTIYGDNVKRTTK